MRKPRTKIKDAQRAEVKGESGWWQSGSRAQDFACSLADWWISSYLINVPDISLWGINKDLHKNMSDSLNQQVRVKLTELRKGNKHGNCRFFDKKCWWEHKIWGYERGTWKKRDKLHVTLDSQNR